jgi:cytochrome c553
MFEDYCAPCHGDAAAGDPDIGAPAIAGLPEWYLLEQLHKYRDGRRGAHKDDAEGLRMRPMSRTLATDTDVELVAAYVASLPTSRPAASIAAGDSDAGTKLYGTCAACHGPDAKGNEQLHAPPLVVQQDWYLARQLGKFKAGVRGVNPKAVSGNQMRPRAATLPDDKAVTDVVTHIQTLGR